MDFYSFAFALLPRPRQHFLLVFDGHYVLSHKMTNILWVENRIMLLRAYARRAYHPKTHQQFTHTYTKWYPFTMVQPFTMRNTNRIIEYYAILCCAVSPFVFCALCTVRTENVPFGRQQWPWLSLVCYNFCIIILVSLHKMALTKRSSFSFGGKWLIIHPQLDALNCFTHKMAVFLSRCFGEMEWLNGNVPFPIAQRSSKLNTAILRFS